MNDRFKFRVYIKYAKIMCYDVNSFYIDRLKNKITIHFDDCTKTFKFDDIVLEQSTGLKDKNSKLIYEGDLIKEPANKHDLEVFYENGAWQTREYRKNGNREQLLYVLINCYGVEVISNIHENTDLLENEE